MSSLSYNGTTVSCGSSNEDLVVNSTNSPKIITGTAYYRNVTIDYGYTLQIARDADFRVNTLLKNRGTITFKDFGAGTGVGVTEVGAPGGGGGGGGGASPGLGGRSNANPFAGGNPGGGQGGGPANETFLSGTIASYTTSIPLSTGTGASGGWGETANGTGGSAGAGGGSFKIIAKTFENYGKVSANGSNGGKGGYTGDPRGTGGGGGGGGAGGSIWVLTEDLRGYGLFEVNGGSGGGEGGYPVDSNNNGIGDGFEGCYGGSGGHGFIRIDAGSSSNFVGYFYPNIAAAFKITTGASNSYISYVPDSAGSVNTPSNVYTFGTDPNANISLRYKMFQSSEIKLISSNQTFVKASSPYYFNTLIVGTGYTLTLENKVVIYCKNLQIDEGGTLQNAYTSGSARAGGGGNGGGGSQYGDGGGGGGYSTAGFSTYSGTGGGIYDAGLGISQSEMYRTNYEQEGLQFHGSNGGPGGGAGAFNQSTSAGGGGWGGGFAKIFAWETVINGTWSAKGQNGGNGTTSMWGSWMDNEVSAGSGGGGSGGAINLVTGSLTGIGKIDIQGGTGGDTQPMVTENWSRGGNGGNGGNGGWGRAYVWTSTTNFNLITNFYEASTSSAVLNTSLVTSLTDASQPSGNLYVYQKALPGGTFETINQYFLQNIRLFDSIKIRHSVSERPYNYEARLYKNNILQSSPAVESGVVLFNNYKNWANYKTITINNTSASYNNYVISITIPYENAKGIDYALRFADAISGSELYYWIEDKTSTSPTVWIKIPYLPTGITVINMYYNNSNVPFINSSDYFRSTFTLFCDDFEQGNSVFLSNWTRSGNAVGFDGSTITPWMATSSYPYVTGSSMTGSYSMALRGQYGGSANNNIIGSSNPYDAIASRTFSVPPGTYKISFLQQNVRGLAPDAVRVTLYNADTSSTIQRWEASSGVSTMHSWQRNAVELNGTPQKIISNAFTISSQTNLKLEANAHTGNYTGQLFLDNIYLFNAPSIPPTVTVSEELQNDQWGVSEPITWSAYKFTQPGEYNFTFYSKDYWNNAGENLSGNLSGSVIPPGIPMSF